jgi:aminomethyltransferase
MYTTVCYPDGGIVDDCIVYRVGPENFRIVVNAANIAKDFAFFKEHVDGHLCADRRPLRQIRPHRRARAPALSTWSLRSPVRTCSRTCPAFGFAAATIAGAAITAARTGYTGEDGFELFMSTPSSAGRRLAALLAARRRPDRPRRPRHPPPRGPPLALRQRHRRRPPPRSRPASAGSSSSTSSTRGEPFVGAEALAAQKAAGLTRTLVGFRVQDRNIARHGAQVVDPAGTVLGTVTSGGPAPTVGGAVGLAYVPIALSAPGTVLTISQRGRSFPAEVVKGPFYRRP